MTNDSEKHLFFLTGELSGDMHAAELVKAIRKLRPKWRITAIGSDHLRDVGAEIWYDCIHLGAIGIYEAVKRAWPVLKLRAKFIRELPEINPDLIVAVDYRAMNTGFLHAAYRLGYRSAYYIAPVAWGMPPPTKGRRAMLRALSVARRSRRIKEGTRDRFTAIAAVTELVLLTYPICEDEYRAAGANVHYVGHPLVNIIENKLQGQLNDYQRAEELAELTSGGRKLIGVLPGSRLHEFRHHCAILRETVARIREEIPKATFFLPLASPSLMPQLERYWPGVRKDCRIVAPDEYDYYKAAHLLLAKSGTAVQTGMILGTPMIAFYRIVSEAMYRISTALFLKRELWTFPNILAGRQIIPEFIQSKMTVENISREALKLLSDEDVGIQMRRELRELRDMLYKPDCLEHSAELIIGVVEK